MPSIAFNDCSAITTASRIKICRGRDPNPPLPWLTPVNRTQFGFCFAKAAKI